MLNSKDPMFIICQRGSIHAWDWRGTKTEASAEAHRLTNAKGTPYDVEDVDDFGARVTKHYLEQFPLCEITEDFHDQMLNCLPPMHRTGAMGFFMVEMTSGSVTTQFVGYKGKRYGAAVDLCNRSTWITPEKIERLEPAEPLTWFPPQKDEAA